MEAKKLIALLEAKLKAKYAETKEELYISVSLEAKYKTTSKPDFYAHGFVAYKDSIFKNKDDEGYKASISYSVHRARTVAELISRFDQEVNGYKKTEKLDLE